MARVFLGVGSNIRREQHICSGMAALHEQFDVRAISTVYESAAVGFVGEPFLNLVVEISTAMPVGDLQQALKAIEAAHGCQRDAPRYSARALDIDILLYGDVVGGESGVVLPREEILVNAFVLWPLAEIAPDLLHPQAQKTYRDLWQAFDKSRQLIVPAGFSLKQPGC